MRNIWQVVAYLKRTLGNVGCALTKGASRYPLVLMVSATLVVVGWILWCWWVAPTWQEISSAPIEDRVSSQVEILKTVAQFALAAGVVVTIFLTERRVRAAERTVEVAQEGQITERFTRAIEQLGNRDSLAIRLGGIYALERIAQDSKTDHWQVIEVLTSYVRENSPYDANIASIQPVTTDIQAIVTVLGRRKAQYDKFGQRIDLSGTHLHGVRLADANLQHATFAGANLRQAVFYRVDFNGAIFQGTILHDTNFEKSLLRRSYLQRADLFAANLEGTDIRKADLSEALNLEPTQIASATSDATTMLPPDLQHLAGAEAL